ncbi:hypothetical protein FACS1894170_13340 [Planctomycetales bacterium]|nr:hypothetical protein FACS1894170_13340 [Planctomycetales bacterium]
MLAYPRELVICVLEAILIATPAYPYPFNGQVGNFGDGNAYGQWGDYEYVQVK